MIDVSTDAQKAEPGPASVSSTVRPQDDPYDRSLALSKQPGSAAKQTSPTHTDISEPRTDMTIVHDPFGRVIRPGHSHQAEAAASSDPPGASQPLSTQTSATLVDTRNRFQDAAQRSLGAPFVDARATPAASSSMPLTPPRYRSLMADLNGSPVRFPSSASRILSLSTSPRTSEGLSVQYDMTPPRTGSGTVPGDTTKTVQQKWRIHFAKPPKSATMAALAKPVTTEALVRNLELGEAAVRF
jgi:hypothetical protein